MESAQQKKHNLGSPLKTCLKSKAKIAPTTLSETTPEATDDASGKRTLRRVKTVDFEDAGKLLLASPTQSNPRKAECVAGTNGITAEYIKSKNYTRKTPSCPDMLSTAKSGLADPAITHTDVHVIAITPLNDADKTIEHAEHNSSGDPATPTMQIVESNSGYYEIVWDDVPAEHNIRTNRRSSSASHSLKAVSPSALRGLQRVSTKLTDWSGSWNAPSGAFKPTIVVYPDNESRGHQFKCAVDDDEELIVTAPPNSQRGSATHSRLSSRPVSAPSTRTASQEEISLNDTLQEGPSIVSQDWIMPLEDTLVVPDTSIQSTGLYNTDRRLRQMPAIRKLSNIEGDDLKFRGHRDSVTLAHSRLMHTGGISPELFTRKDSVALARKRLYARNHAVSAANNMKARRANISLDDSFLGVPVVREPAAQTLKPQKSSSMLESRSPIPQRHIKIMD
jgi:hypothetical protein